MGKEKMGAETPEISRKNKIDQLIISARAAVEASSNVPDDGKKGKVLGLEVFTGGINNASATIDVIEKASSIEELNRDMDKEFYAWDSMPALGEILLLYREKKRALAGSEKINLDIDAIEEAIGAIKNPDKKLLDSLQKLKDNKFEEAMELASQVKHSIISVNMLYGTDANYYIADAIVNLAVGNVGGKEKMVEFVNWTQK